MIGVGLFCAAILWSGSYAQSDNNTCLQFQELPPSPSAANQERTVLEDGLQGWASVPHAFIDATGERGLPIGTIQAGADQTCQCSLPSYKRLIIDLFYYMFLHACAPEMRHMRARNQCTPNELSASSNGPMCHWMGRPTPFCLSSPSSSSPPPSSSSSSSLLLLLLLLLPPALLRSTVPPLLEGNGTVRSPGELGPFSQRLFNQVCVCA